MLSRTAVRRIRGRSSTGRTRTPVFARPSDSASGLLFVGRAHWVRRNPRLGRCRARGRLSTGRTRTRGFARASESASGLLFVGRAHRARRNPRLGRCRTLGRSSTGRARTLVFARTTESASGLLFVGNAAPGVPVFARASAHRPHATDSRTPVPRSHSTDSAPTLESDSRHGLRSDTPDTVIAAFEPQSHQNPALTPVFTYSHGQRDCRERRLGVPESARPSVSAPTLEPPPPQRNPNPTHGGGVRRSRVSTKQTLHKQGCAFNHEVLSI